MWEETVLVPFMKKFDAHPFLIKTENGTYRIGEGKPDFTVRFNRPIPLKELVTSTSLSLGEAYMDGDMEIEGDLYNALDHFMGQMGKFSTDQGVLKKLMFTSTAKKNQKKEVQSHYDTWKRFLQAVAG